MQATQHIGIIDIGSNSIRLVIYEQNERGSYRVIDEAKASARLSEKTRPDGRLAIEDLTETVQTISRFRMLCEAHRVDLIRTVATAAVRNCLNCEEVTAFLREQTGLSIEVLSGEEEARYGFIGTINTMDVQDGLLIDIGGGSTELTMFRNRSIVESVSFPFGAVNTTKAYTRGGEVDADVLQAIRSMVETSLSQHKWIKKNTGLPLIGLGGTIRSVSKIVQRQSAYSLPIAHRYELTDKTVDSLLDELGSMTVDNRKNIDGLDKNRADLIVAGLVIMETVFRYSTSSVYWVSGSGLRDGIYYEMIQPNHPVQHNVLSHSVRNLLGLHPSVPVAHVEQVNRIALVLFDALTSGTEEEQRWRQYLSAASLLYRIGVTVDFYRYEQHTFYLMAHSRMDGLTHREMLICALTAAYQTKSRSRKMYLPHKDIVSEDDLRLASKLGTLLRIAVALDRSETQPISSINAYKQKTGVQLHLTCIRFPEIELIELQALLKPFKQLWGTPLHASLEVSNP